MVMLQIMENCKFDSLRGFAYKLPNSIINCDHIIPGAVLMPIANAIQLFDGLKSNIIFEAKRQISAIDMRGSLIVLGQRASPGQLISAVLLDMNQIQKPKFFNYQKTTINFISISLDGEFIVSVGSSSQNTQELNVIEVNNQSEIGTRVFFSKVLKKKNGKVKTIKFSNKDPRFFVLVTACNITFFKIDQKNQLVQEVEAKTSKVREYNNFIFSPDGNHLFGCSKNGDIAQISISQCKETRVGPRKRVITKGITNIRYIDPGILCISGKQGMIAFIEESTMKLIKEIRLEDEEVVSFSEFSKGHAYIATNKAVIYDFDAQTCNTKVIYTCHSKKINDITMINNFSGVFGTCSGGEIVVWKLGSLSPILKIQLPKVNCLSICFPKTGRLILSGWSDDAIRIFSPNHGKLVHRIPYANLGKPKVIIADQDSSIMLVGGQNGVIRIWNILQNKRFGVVEGALVFHMKPVHGLSLNPVKTGILASCSEDGQVGIWNLKKFELIKNFVVNNFLNQITFLNQNVIRTWGAGNTIYDCLISDGNIANTIEVNGTYLNSLRQCYIEQTEEKLIFYGGDEPFLDYFDKNQSPLEIHRHRSFGQIVKMGLSHDHKKLIVGTENGIILSYSIFAIKQLQQDTY